MPSLRWPGKTVPIKGKVVELVNGQEVKPAVDISITKNVCGVFISVLLVIWCILSVARWHKSQGMKGPRKMTGAIELVILFIYDGVIKPTLKNKANKFAPYLLTVFFFILVMNLLGLIVIFPGGANLTGNIAVTLVLAIITFLITNIFATKHYWKEVFNPDVPWWFKWPIPIMPVIEIFGIFTKPAAPHRPSVCQYDGRPHDCHRSDTPDIHFCRYGASRDRSDRSGEHYILGVHASPRCARELHPGICVHNALDTFHRPRAGRRAS